MTGCLITLIALGISGLGGRNTVAAEPSGPRIVYGLTYLPTGFDPYVNAEPDLGIVLRSVYDTLVYRDPQTREIVAGLAEKWDISADGKTYTFHLRTGVKFHDNTPFDAYAVGVTLDRVVNPATKSQKAIRLLGPYDHYQVRDPQTIDIVLKAPYTPLLDSFCQVYLGIASPKALEAYDLPRYQFHQVGTGPYKLVDYLPGDHLTLRRNHDYAWGPKFYAPWVPTSIEEIEFRFYIDPATRVPALTSGAAQIMDNLSADDALLVSRATGVRLLPQSIPGQPVQLFFNTKVAPTDKLEVRQALILATNRIAIVDNVLKGFASAAYGPLAATTPLYEPTMAKAYPYNTTEALKLLTKAGYVLDTTDKLLKLNNKPLHLVMIVTPYGSIPEIAKELQSQWRDLGIEVELRKVPNKAGQDAEAKKGDYSLSAAYDFGLDASLITPYYHMGGALNYTNYADKKLDTALDQGLASLKPLERRTAYANIQIQVMQQALVLPLYDYVTLNGISTALDGLTFDPYGWYPLLANVTIHQKSPTGTPQPRQSPTKSQ